MMASRTPHGNARKKGALLKVHRRLAVGRAAFLLGTTGGLLLAWAGWAGPLSAQAARASQYPEADIAYGARLYTAHCSICHGPNGDSVAGVDLRSGRLRNATTDQQLTTLITTGIAGTGMPAFKLDAADLTGIVAYVRNMSTFEVGAVQVGDVDRGRTLFQGKGGCAKCHRVDGTGVGMAPDLGGIGTVRTASALHTSVLDPSSAMIPINRPVRAVTKDGRTISGRRLNEDTYTVQLMDDQGRLVALQKADLREYTVLTTSPMPSYQGKLSPAEVADLVAYLLSLKGA